MNNHTTTTPHVTPRDFFLWVGAMVSLYASVVALISLLFSYINHLFPDVLEYGYYADPYSTGIRVAIATLIVATPLFLGLTRAVNLDALAHPEKRGIWVRRWLVHFTLFVAGATLAIDLVTLVYQFLGGDLTTRFALKALTVFVVVGAGLLYYVGELRGFWQRNRPAANAASAGVLVAVIASIVLGFFVIGTPGHARLVRLDAQKVSDLQTIQYQITSYWQSKEALPVSLEALKDPLVGVYIPEDAQFGAPYEYLVTGTRTFELCANFNATTEGPRGAEYSTARMPYADENWQHGSGRVCFERTIDPDRFPPIEKPRPTVL